MPLRIAFDLDGVLADMESELVRQAELVFGETMTGDAPDRTTDNTLDVPTSKRQVSADAAPTESELRLQMTLRQQRKLWRHVETIENFWETLDELEPGAVARLAALAVERRWEIIFLTKRPASAGASAQLQSQRWLESKGFALPSVYVVQGSRGRIAAALGLDIVVDDRPENCLDVAGDSKARAILVWREEDPKVPIAAQRLGIGVVHSVGQCLDILVELDEAGNQDAGMMSKVMRLLGVKEAAPA